MKNSRRSAIKKFAALTAGLNLFTLPGFPNSNFDELITGLPNPITPFFLPSKEKLLPGPGGINIRTWVRSAQTNSQFSNVETAIASMQMGPAPHIHKKLDELMYVIEGEVSVMLNENVEVIPEGAWHFRPHGIEHTFWNASNKPARFFDMYFNQNFEDYLEELFHKIIPHMIQNHLTPASPVIAQRMENLNKRFGVTMFPENRQRWVEKYKLNG